MTRAESPGTVVIVLAVRQTRSAAILIVSLCAAMSAVVVLTYRGTVGSEAGSLAALAGNPAVRTLFGEPVALDQAGGFTVWRTGTVLAVLLASWGCWPSSAPLAARRTPAGGTFC
jgi:ABC-2 type transport system permease protein